MTCTIPPASWRAAAARAGWALLGSLLLSACSGAPARPQEQGEGASSGGKRPSIVSLNPCTDAILAEVTAPGQLLAISGYSHDPSSTSMGLEAAARYRGVSGSVEEVAALAPDVVVAGSFLAPPTANALRDLGIRVVLEPIVSDVEGAREQVRMLAELSGDKAAGERLVARIDDALRRNAAPADWTPVPSLVWESAGLVAGNDTLVVDLLEHSGFVNSAGARGLGQAEFLPLEQVLADPPRVIFAVGNPLAEEDRMLHHPVLADMKNTLRIPLSRSLIWCGGPTVPRLLDRLGRARRAWLGRHGDTREGAEDAGHARGFVQKDT
ncbi:ABC transporter substrate-binding protein [Novosphingobium decolorationis]|uniref:ABC transporter substrate-binding protein n=1 Tax=Novosphingobium decolorationis TaxID=2698673 RepID=A0ABX8EC97_9SPHN|nr:helical backbone metal receptor [Novosphingobium decolorationis]QVM85596.1 ABC transporter substrate-binding protein [Novosphingobium decolorationis]